MKLRCERDVLVEALGTAGRAVPAGAGRFRSWAGSACRSTGDALQVTGTDLDLTITVAGDG